MLVVAIGFGRMRLDSGYGLSQKAAIGWPTVARAAAAVSSATVGPSGVRSMNFLCIAVYSIVYSFIATHTHQQPGCERM